MNRSFRNRRGITSLIAMLFMILIGTLALGFYTSVTTATALAKNDRRTAKALMAAESGIQFMRNRLAHTTIPPNTQSNNLLNELEADLRNDDVISGNLLGAPIVRQGNVLTIPLIITDAAENSGFTVTLTDIGAVGEIVCTVKGRSGLGGSVSQKGVRLDFTRQPVQTNIFDNAVSAKGKLVMQKGSITGVSGVSSDAIIKIMSAQTSNGAIVMSGGTIGSVNGGELGVVIDNDFNGLPDALATTISGGTVHGTSNITTIKNNYVKLVGAPDFPIVDTTQFAAYATNNYGGQNTGTLKNIRVPAGTNPKFTGNVTIQGVLYVESPNSIQFQGNTTLEGFIVFENKNSSAQNVINVTGNFGYGNLPSGSEFDSLRAVKGFSMLAPTTSLQMAGGADSQLRGNMLLGNFRNTGSGDVQIEKGSIITFDTAVDSAVFNGRSIRFMSTGASNQPSAGLLYSEKFVPSKGSYLELN